MPKIEQKQAQIICFCGRVHDVHIRVEQLLAGINLVQKCECGINHNLRVHLNARAQDRWPNELPPARRARTG